MLQATNPETEAAQTRSLVESISWAAGVIRRQLVLIALITLLTLSLGALYAFMASPSYTAEATLMIDPRRLQLFQGATYAEGHIDALTLESQLELIRSERVASSVVNELGLSRDPEFARTGSRFGEALSAYFARFGEALSAYFPRLGAMLPTHFFHSNDPLSEFEATRAAVARVVKNLTVTRTGASYVLGVKYRSLSPERAAQIANAIAEAYIAEQLDGKYESTRRATQWLQGRIEELNQKRAAAERAIIDFKQQNNMIAADGKLVNERQIAELNSQLAGVRARTSEAKARLDRVDAVIRNDGLDSKSDPTVADMLSNPIITKLRSQYLEFSNREATYSRKYGSNHQAVVTLGEQMRDIRRSILEELKRLRESYLSNYEIARQEEMSLQERLGETISQSQPINRAQVALRELESSAHTFRTLHDSFLQRYTESLLQQSFPIADARIIARAATPLSKSGAGPALILVAAVASGLFLGVGLGTLRELMDRSFCTSAQVENELQTACISIVPSSKSYKGLNPRIVVSSPFSRYAEAIRSIKVRIDLDHKGKRSSNVIGLISSLPNEGKSTIATCLALHIAQVGSRVILVDCDLRNPSLSRRLAPGADSGFLGVVSGETTLDDAIWADQLTNLAFLPAGVKGRCSDSSELLSADATKRLFEELRSRYDYILVDLPPLVPIVDVRATTGFIDAYMCVIEWRSTGIEVVRHAFNGAWNVYEKLIGVVLNKVDIDRLGNYESVGRSYYSDRHLVQYGLTDEPGFDRVSKTPRLAYH